MLSFLHEAKQTSFSQTGREITETLQIQRLTQTQKKIIFGQMLFNPIDSPSGGELVNSSGGRS